MECVGYTVEPEVPKELSTAASCTTAFFRVASALDQLEGEEAIKKHTLFTTRRGHLVEAVGGLVQRSTPSPKDVTKIVVHHDFEPLQLYVVLLCGSGKAVLLAYTDFKVLHEWEKVTDIASADPKCTGSPQLILTKAGGESVLVSNTQLMSFVQGERRPERKEMMEEEEEEEKMEEEESAEGKRSAVQALMHRFKGGIRHAEQLKNERKIKENFIAEELTTLQSLLKGRIEERQESLVAAVSIGEVQDSVPTLSPGPLKVLRVYHNLMYDKWVIMINVYNESEHMLVTKLEFMQCCEEGLLHHTSQVLKTVKHRSPTEVRLTISHLDPLILRPKKRATVIGVCDVPSFKSGPSVTCSGLLSYTIRPVEVSSGQRGRAVDHSQAMEYQVSIPAVMLEAHELHQSKSSWERCVSTRTEGVSFSTVSLVAASYHSHVSLTSLVSPLDGFLTRISQHHKFIKVSGVSDFYLLYPTETHPLQHCGFILHPTDSHTLNLDLFTRDEKQAMVLAHSFLAALPKDISLEFHHSPRDAESSRDAQPLNIQHQLLARMRETATHVVDGLEAQITSKAAKKRKEGREQEDMSKYAREREEFLARKEDVVFSSEEYRKWRKALNSMMTEVDGLYLKYLKANCG